MSGCDALTISAARSVEASRKSLLNVSFLLGQTGAQSPHITQRPRSIWTGLSVIAPVGQAAMQAVQALSQAALPMTGLPRRPTGLAVRGSLMYCVPWDTLTAIDLSMV